MIRSFEGLIGCKFPEHNVFVTSPNMQMIYHPLLGERRVRMRCDWHFGEDDPLHHPQPWSPEIGHLAVIRIANQDTTRPGDTILWWPPHIDEFEPLDVQSTHTQTSASALGHIKETHRQLLVGARSLGASTSNAGASTSNAGTSTSNAGASTSNDGASASNAEASTSGTAAGGPATGSAPNTNTSGDQPTSTKNKDKAPSEESDDGEYDEYEGRRGRWGHKRSKTDDEMSEEDENKLDETQRMSE